MNLLNCVYIILRAFPFRIILLSIFFPVCLINHSLIFVLVAYLSTLLVVSGIASFDMIWFACKPAIFVLPPIPAHTHTLAVATIGIVLA